MHQARSGQRLAAVVTTSVAYLCLLKSTLAKTSFFSRVFLSAYFIMAILELGYAMKGALSTAGKGKLRPFKHAPTVALVVQVLALSSLWLYPQMSIKYFVVIATAIVADLSALVVGKSFGKAGKNLFSKISPQKTFIGYLTAIFTGNMSAALLLVKLAKQYPELINCPTGDLMFISLAGSSVIAGDLIGSAAKRQLGIKDSRHALVRHCPHFAWFEIMVSARHGFLDTVDSTALLLLMYLVTHLAIG